MTLRLAQRFGRGATRVRSDADERGDEGAPSQVAGDERGARRDWSASAGEV